MTQADNITKKLEQITFKSTPKMREKILSEASQAMEQTINASATKPSVRRMIMKNIKIRKVKVAIVTIVLMILLGLIPLNGTTAFGNIAHGITNTMARLKAMVLGEEVPEEENVERKIDESVAILTQGRVFSSPEISSLEDFLNERNISFVSENSGTVKYTSIPSDKVTALQEFLKSSDSFSIVVSTNTLTHAGEKAVIVISNTAGAAITALQNKNEQLHLKFAFHNGLDGCDIEGIDLGNGEALLISGISSNGETSDDLITILVLPEVTQE